MNHIVKFIILYLMKKVPALGHIISFLHSRRFTRIHSFSELYSHIDKFYKEYEKSEINGLKGIEEYFFDPGDLRLPKDPFSESYYQAQMELYCKISGKTGYTLQNESTLFDFQKEKNNFFPYSTQDPKIIGRMLQVHGFALQSMALPKGARIVEFGAGWGNITLQLILSGFKVTVVEINKPSTDLIKHRAALYSRDVEVENMDMIEFASHSGSAFDAALFVQVFHHCQNPVELVKNLSRILKPDGVVYLVDEPVYAGSKNPFLPYPWGIRLDLNSLFYSRKFGWLELGFQYPFLEELFNRNGMQLTTITSFSPGIGNIYVARKTV